MWSDHSATRRALLGRRGIVVQAAGIGSLDEIVLQALDLELVRLGYVLSDALKERLRTLSTQQVAVWHTGMLAELAALRGSDQVHTPLFRRFPEGIPADTYGLWVDRLLVHYFQGVGQPCLHCARVGTTHVLDPCCHVVCEHCFDPTNYSGCPICGKRVDREGRYFLPSPKRVEGTEDIQLQLLHLGDDLEVQARALFEQLCARPQALSPDDKAALVGLLEDFGDTVLDWLPPKIPLRENIALIFGTICGQGDPVAGLLRARPYMTTATDALRFVAAYSGADPALQPEPTLVHIPLERLHTGVLKNLIKSFKGAIPKSLRHVSMMRAAKRFTVARLSRPLRRALLGFLESLPESSRVEDMLRHRSYWVWLGQFLHPHEYESRFPGTARAFLIVRGKRPDGTPAPPSQTFASQVERAVSAGDVLGLVGVLKQRPGELGRRLDHALRLAATPTEAEAVLVAAEEAIPAMATPMLVCLSAHFRTRAEPAPVRLYWPKGGSAQGASADDTRPSLDPAHINRLVAGVEAQLLARLAEKSPALDWVLDEGLVDLIVPFNERTASSSAVSLTRGSSVKLPDGKTVRLFMHWCERPKSHESDLDLSVGFYDADWQHAGTCSYYELRFEDVAKSAGDITSAPFPEGSSEFVDIDLDAARARGLRYVVVVVNAYSGPPFNALERAFAGVMLRDEPMTGEVFDPRTVELKFQVTGANGVYLPLVLDLESRTLHWLDVFNKGQLAMNNVATSNRAIQRLCPEAIAYFGSGARASMFDLGTLHAAARAHRVFLRGPQGLRRFTRGDAESAEAFLARLRSREGGESVHMLPERTVTAMLVRGDIALPEGSEVYALFRGVTAPTLSASDLLS